MQLGMTLEKMSGPGNFSNNVAIVISQDVPSIFSKHLYCIMHSVGGGAHS